MSTPALNPLVTKIRGMHPGAYDDMDDATLTKAVLAKYPQYSDLAAGAPPQRPAAPEMRQSYAGELYGRQAGQGNNEPSPKGQMAQQTQPNPAVGALAVGGAAAMAGAAALPFLRSAIKPAADWVGANPIKSMIAIEGAKRLPGAAGQIASKIPIWLPMLAGGKAPEAEAGEGEIATDQIPGRPYQPNPRYEPQPEAAPLPPRNGPLLLKGNVQAPPEPTPALPTSVTKLPWQQTLEKSLGNEPVQLKPNVPLRDQLPFTKKAGSLLEGHTPVESSWIKSYKYDPASQEFELAPKSGSPVRLGGVSPEDAQDFANSDSKGAAWQKIKQNVQVAKFVNGKWITTPGSGPRSASPDEQ